MKIDDIDIVAMFVSGGGKGKEFKAPDKRLSCTKSCLISSGKTIAKWNESGNEIILPSYSDSSLSKLDVRRRIVTRKLAQSQGTKVTMAG